MSDHHGDIMQTAAVAAAATTLAAAACGAIERGNPAAPLNAVSHIAWGDTAARRRKVSLKYTGVGVLLNAAAMVSWAAFHHVAFKPAERRSGAVEGLMRGAGTAAIAYVIDYHVLPKRLTPGLEKRLSRWSVFSVYAALAVSLAVGERLAASSRPTSR